jgi:hypothetical protein
MAEKELVKTVAYCGLVCGVCKNACQPDCRGGGGDYRYKEPQEIKTMLFGYSGT